VKSISNDNVDNINELKENVGGPQEKGIFFYACAKRIK
jgi:hypothetical protein